MNNGCYEILKNRFEVKVS